MVTPSRQELLDRIEELETENESLQSRLDEIADIIGSNNEEDSTDDAEDETEAEIEDEDPGEE